MAPAKRKRDAANIADAKLPRKKVRVVPREVPKDQQPDTKSARGKKRTPSDAFNSATNAPQVSIFREEEPSFPRGGGSILTPLEKKQIQGQANRDVLFEQEGRGRPANEFDFDGDDVESGDASKPTSAPKRAKKTNRKPEPSKGGSREDAAGARVESLNYKRVVPGSLILGQVSTIRPHEIAIALPNNLTGYLPLTAVSDKLTEKIEALVNEQEGDSEGGVGSSVQDDVDLRTYFTVGQYLRTFVTSTAGGDGDALIGGRKRIELSINPRQTNGGLERSDLPVNTMVSASVSSIEDHGLVMDIGIPGVKGFVSSKATGNSIQYADIKEGAVMLCIVTGHGSSGSVVKLSTDLRKAGNIKKGNFVPAASTINPFLPGTAAEIQLSWVGSSGMVGKIMGMLDVTADLVHSGASMSQDSLAEKYQPGQKIKGRIICTFPTADSKKLGFSILPHVVSLTQPAFVKHGVEQSPDMPSISAIIPKARVAKVEPNVGLFVDLGSKATPGFVHISRVADRKVESLSASTSAYKVGSEHQARIIGQNAMDGLFFLSMERKVIDQPYIRIEDVKIGAIVKGTVERLLIGPQGVDGAIVKIADQISGLVPGIHLADTQLQHPEKKFRQGVGVKAKVLSTNIEKGQLRLTLKRSLVNSELDIWKDYIGILPGRQSQGTLKNVKPHGAVVQFYGSVKGFLPVGEMSEAFIRDATQHFRVGQVVTVHALSVDAERSRLALSCKDPSSFSNDHQAAFEKLQPGALVVGSVFEKSADDVLLNLDSGLIARLEVDHLCDKSLRKSSAKLKDIRVGQKLQDLLVLEIQRTRRLIQLSNKPSLIQAAKKGELLKAFGDVKDGMKVAGFVKNWSVDGIFVGFAGGLTGLIPRSHIADDVAKLPNFGLRRFQSISATVFSVDNGQQRFYLTMKAPELSTRPLEVDDLKGKPNNGVVVDPVDGIATSLQDFSMGKLTKARITSVKQTQINILLAQNIQGRIHISEVFDRWEDIKDKKRPLSTFETGQVLPVRVLGIHDARNHRFLPITNKSGKTPVYELSAKSNIFNAEAEVLTLDQVKVGSSWTAFVNNVAVDCIWVNLSPIVRGIIRAFDISNDLSLLSDLEKNFPVGSALQVVVTNVKADTNHLTLSAKNGGAATELKMAELSRGMILPGRVIKISDKQILVHLSDSIVGAVSLIDMADDYAQANTASYEKNEIIRVSVVQVDLPNKKVILSTRPSKILSSLLEVKDPEIQSVDQLEVNDVVRGFVQHVADNGLYITLGHKVTGYVRVTNLSDTYLKEWKDGFQVDQLIQGKIISIDRGANKVQMSLKASVMDPNYVAPISFNDLKLGQVVTGKVRKVEDFGVFIVVDGSSNVSGLCHRSEIADQRVEDARKLYEEGDVVKAKVLKLDAAARRINFGLKASYFQFQEGPDEDGGSIVEQEEGNDSDEMKRVQLADEGEDDDDEKFSDGGVGIESESNSGVSDAEDAAMKGLNPDADLRGLSSVGFDWTGKIDTAAEDMSQLSSDDGQATKPPKKKRRRPEIKIDKTGNLDAHGPQSAADFERLLLGEPDSSYLWLSYMAFQLELSEVDKARNIAERALRTIDASQESEKMNVWVALLNLENTYGSDETIGEAFERACQYNDAQEIHERLASIYIQSGKTEKADSIFQALTKKFSQDPKVWTNYAHFLFSTASAPDHARALLPQAMQSLPPYTHIDLTSKFGQLEFNSKSGDPERGRTIFEGLLGSFPKRVDLWNVLIDCEIKAGDREVARGLFERVTAPRKLKNKKAKFFFKKWLAFEEGIGDEKMVKLVKRKAEEFVRAQKELKE